MCVKLQMRLYVCQAPCPFWVHFGSILGPFWVHFGSILGPFWVHFGSILGPFWGPFWVHFGVHFGSILGPFWVHFGSILGPFGSQSPKKQFLNSFSIKFSVVRYVSGVSDDFVGVLLVVLLRNLLLDLSVGS